MTRGTIWGAVVVLGLATLGLRWFVEMFEPVSVTRSTGVRDEARRDPYLALTRFLERMGRAVERTSDPHRLLSLDGPGVLVLDRRRAYHLSTERAGAVRQWVEEGGYLILVPEIDGTPDLLVDDLDLEWATPAGDATAESEEVDDAVDAAAGVPDTPGRPDRKRTPLPALPETTTVRVPGAGRPLTIDGYRGLEPGDITPVWTAGNGPWGQQVMHLSVGSGAVTVVVDFDRLTHNTGLGHRDHAEFVWQLIQRYGPAGPVVLLSRLDVPSLWDWLFTSARAALAAGLLALVLWIWHVAPRFGGVILQPPPDRRQLHEHLTAVGRFLWRQQGPEVWLGVMRAALAEKVVRRVTPAALGRERVHAVAVQTGLPAGVVARALEGPAHDAATFIAAAQALQSLDRKL